MAWHAAVAALALVGTAAAIQAVPETVPTSSEGDSKLRTRYTESAEIAQRIQQSSEVLLGVPMLESEACAAQAENFDEGLINRSEWKHMDPPVMPEAGKGARRRMYEIGGMEYELFLPKHWQAKTKFPYPVIVYFHSYTERKWGMLNSQGLARLLANNQSTSFNSRQCWCIQDSELVEGTTTGERNYFPLQPEIYEDSESGPVNKDTASLYLGPMADCAFAEKFNAVVIFVRDTTYNSKFDYQMGPMGPKPSVRLNGKLGPHYTTWTTSSLMGKAKDITKEVIEKYNGDADQVMLAGSMEGAYGAVQMAKAYPGLFSALILTDPISGPDDNPLDMTGLETMPVLVSSDKAAAELTNDDLVENLKARANAATKYYRFKESPEAADPGLRNITGVSHTADFVYRNPYTWSWVAQFFSGEHITAKDFKGFERWGTADKGYLHVGYTGYNPTMPPLGDQYNPTMPPLHADALGYNPTRPPAQYNPTRPPA